MNDAASMDCEVGKTLNCMNEVSSVMVSYGLSFDANFSGGFPINKELAHTIKCGTCPEWKSGVVIKFGKDVEDENK